jgi:hypothetical protein
MAYFIFRKYLDSLEDLRKNPHVKSLINLLVQISKLCQKSEFQINFEKVLFLELGPAQVSAQPPGPWPSAGQLSPPPHSSWTSASRPARPTPAPSPSPSSSRSSPPPSARAPVCRHARLLPRPPPLLPEEDTVLVICGSPHQLSPHARPKRPE